MQDLKISTIQINPNWEQVDANLKQIESMINDLDQTDVIILPEMFSTGFSMNAIGLAEEAEGKTTRWMLSVSKKTQSLIIGSIIFRESNNYYNRLLAAKPDGSIEIYDKRHLFGMANEDKTYSSGNERIIVNWKGWRILPLVCYDLRFPVWSRNLNSERELVYDLLVYVANWPASRIGAWDILLKARAIENLSYCAGVNRIGSDGNSVEYDGHTGIYDFKGDALYFSMNEEHATTQLSGNGLLSYRAKFPAHLDSDHFKII